MMSEPVGNLSATKPCCNPARPKGLDQRTDRPMPLALSNRPFKAVDVPGGTAWLGTNTAGMPDDGETPLRKKRMKPFRIAPTTVTNADFAQFVDETGYVTEAETFGWSFVFWSDVPSHIAETRGIEGVEWWRRVDGATWKDVSGPGTYGSAWHADHPVVQVSWNDAVAYARWAGGRLPTEAEWEHAARGGQGDVRFPWGDQEPDDSNAFPCNIWQGTFPQNNTAADGWATTAPARSFAPNAYGLYNLVGNVWEWTADTYRVKTLKKQMRQRLEAMRGFKVTKGGSFLCHRSYCYRYRIAARTGNSPDSTTTHTGFRMVWDV